MYYLKIFCVCLMLMLGMLSVSSYAKDDVILQGDGAKVTALDLERYITMRLPENQRLGIISRAGFFKEAVENIYLIRMLAAQGQVNDELDANVIQWGAQMDADRAYMASQLDYFLNKQLDRVDWESRAREFYMVDKSRFHEEAKIHAAHILIKAVGRSDVEALELVRVLRAQIMKGEDFLDLAKENSEDVSATRNGGDLGLFSRGRMVAEFEDAAFALTDVGDVSQPVKSQFGYHLIKLMGKKPASKQNFDDIKESLMSELRAEAWKVEYQNYLLKLKSDKNLDFSEKAMSQVVERYRAEIQQFNSKQKASLEK